MSRIKLLLLALWG